MRNATTETCNEPARLSADGLPLSGINACGPARADFCRHPYDTPSRLYARFRPLTLYLGGVLERPINLLIASSYDEQIAMKRLPATSAPASPAMAHCVAPATIS